MEHMEADRRTQKKSSILKKLESYLSFKRRAKSSAGSKNVFSNPLKNKGNTKRQVTPTGCFTVYVGPEKQRFMIKTEYANHPLFKMLLDDAELEYGFKNEGPLHLPCDADLFVKVLAEMDSDKDCDIDNPNCGFAYGYCSPFSPARRLGKSEMAKGSSTYSLLARPCSLKINHF
ncbi:hypothetical protein CDL12_04768 [Handroanthus impetiginosus]|uniref:Small auxin-up RNA n=1 Tax=Handroanthus impetiginosus TaxID=429701 RepID=A0A2G9HYV0_9LAMI|nr:hypothetical protein CDL12_04768 [Handroanthus impetiginosus]